MRTSCWRYSTALAALTASRKKLTAENSMDALINFLACPMVCTNEMVSVAHADPKLDATSTAVSSRDFH
jgi:hypothetical protein